MSLIAWWPLSGDIKDKIGRMTQMGSTDITSTTGKIGSGYYFNGSTSEVVGILNADIVARINSGTVSVAMWVKLDTTSSEWDQLLTIGNRGTGWNDIRIGLDLSTREGLKFSVSDGMNYSGRVCGTSAIHDGLWHHLVGTSNNGTIKLYVDGELKSEQSGQPTPQVTTSQYVCIGGSSNERGQGCLQDVRIYDHVLSKKEIKELSKALVLHYTFDNSSFEPATNVNTVSGWSTYSAYWTISERTTTGLKLYRHTGSTSDCVAIQNSVVTSKMAQGDIWTFSCYLYKNGQPWKSTASGISSEGYGYKTVSWESRDDGYYRITFQIISSPGAWVLHNYFFSPIDIGVNCEMRYMQFEKKDHATLYTPDTHSAILSNNAGINIENNVSIANTIYSSDAAIGSGALKCSNTSLRTPITGDITQGVTISCWVKGSVPTDSRVVFADYNSKLAFGFYNNGQAIITCAGYGHKCVTDIKTPWTSNWNHIVVRRDSAGAVKCFLNNNDLALSGSREWTHSENTFSIGSRYSGGWTSYFNGLVDDVRVYHTTLSDDDIKELYSTRWAATRQGQVFSNTLNEGQSKFQITRSGVNNCSEIIEHPNLPSGYTALDKIWLGPGDRIATYYTPNQNTGIDIEFELTDTANDKIYVFGAGGANYTDRTFELYPYSGDFDCNFGNNSVNIGTLVLNKKIRFIRQQNKVTMYINGVKYTAENVMNNFTCPNTLYLGILNRNSTALSKATFPIYRCVITESGQLIRYYIPCINPSGQRGMYELVTKQFTVLSSTNSVPLQPTVQTHCSGTIYCSEFNEI